MYARASRGGMPRRTASACTIGQATATQQSSALDHTQPAAESQTSTYASTKRLGGSGWPS